jgi:uncharacterized protein YndB with AHSA1/START domain
MTAPQNAVADPDLDRIERSVHIGASPAKVWRALTEADLLARWFGERMTVDLRVGGELTLHWDVPADVRPEDEICYGTFRAVITEIEPERVLAFRWALRAELDPVPGTATDVRFTLRADGTGTLLTVVESGFSTLTVADPRATRAKNTDGWAWELGELVRFLDPAAA